MNIWNIIVAILFGDGCCAYNQSFSFMRDIPEMNNNKNTLKSNRTFTWEINQNIIFDISKRVCEYILVIEFFPIRKRYIWFCSLSFIESNFEHIIYATIYLPLYMVDYFYHKLDICWILQYKSEFFRRLLYGPTDDVERRSRSMLWYEPYCFFFLFWKFLKKLERWTI